MYVVVDVVGAPCSCGSLRARPHRPAVLALQGETN